MNYTNPNTEHYKTSDELQHRKIFHCYKQMKKHIAGKVIDMGCGDGCVTIKLIHKNPRIFSVLCVDNNDRNLHIASLISETKKIDLDRPPYKLYSNLYDTVISTDVLEHVLSPYVYLSECYRILSKENGRIILTTPDAYRSQPTLPHINYFTWQSLKLLLRRCGFRKIKRFYNGVVSPELTDITSNLPCVRNVLSNGLYVVAWV